MSKWTYNDQESDIWSFDHYDTKEEAIAAGEEEAKELGWLFEFFVGEVVETPIDYKVDASDVIDKAAEHIDDNYGGDWDPGETFVSMIKDEDTECLDKLLNDAFAKWIEERGIKSHTFLIKNTERIELEDQK